MTIFFMSISGLVDNLHNFENLTPEEKEARKQLLEKHVSQLGVILLRAVDFLKEVYQLWSIRNFLYEYSVTLYRNPPSL